MISPSPHSTTNTPTGRVAGRSGASSMSAAMIDCVVDAGNVAADLGREVGALGSAAEFCEIVSPPPPPHPFGLHPMTLNATTISPTRRRMITSLTGARLLLYETSIQRHFPRCVTS